MARNRKRAKERRSRRPATGSGSRPEVVSARAERERGATESAGALEHASPDTELAEAQLALGRPDLAAAADMDDTELAEEAMEANGAPRGGRASAELAAATETAPAERRNLAGRLVTFLQGCWRELQRVQWPDRRQVMQATGVVIGFVIVAGVYLGVADALASKLVKLILQ